MVRMKVQIDDVLKHAEKLAEKYLVRVNPELFRQFLNYRVSPHISKKHKEVASELVYSWVCDYNRFANQRYTRQRIKVISDDE